MNNKLYVGGLPYSVTEAHLEEVFSAHGTVESARVITDRMSGRSRGFGFVELSTQEEAEEAMQKLNGTELEGRTLTVNEAKPQQPRALKAAADAGNPIFTARRGQPVADPNRTSSTKFTSVASVLPSELFGRATRGKPPARPYVAS